MVAIIMIPHNTQIPAFLFFEAFSVSSIAFSAIFLVSVNALSLSSNSVFISAILVHDNF